MVRSDGMIRKIRYRKDDSYKSRKGLNGGRFRRMSDKLFILCIFAVFLSVVSSFPHREMLDCKGKPDGVYPDPDDKRGYYVCMDHLPFVHLDCDEGEHFDDSFKTCVKDASNMPDAPLPDGEIPQNYVSNKEEEIEGIKQEVSQFLGLGNDPKLPEGEVSSSQYKVFNIQITKNIFPQSVVIVGKANREQKNK